MSEGEEEEEEERMEEEHPSLTLGGIFAAFLLMEKDPMYNRMIWYRLLEIRRHCVAFVVVKSL